MSIWRLIVGERADDLARWLMHGAPVQTVRIKPDSTGHHDDDDVIQQDDEPFVFRGDDELLVLTLDDWGRVDAVQRNAIGGDHRLEVILWNREVPLTRMLPSADVSFRLLRVPSHDSWHALWVAHGPRTLSQQQEDGLWLLDGVRDRDRLSVNAQFEVVLGNQSDAGFDEALVAVRALLRRRSAVVLRSAERLAAGRVEALRALAHDRRAPRPVVHVFATDDHEEDTR